ncbi:MAG: acyltransferase [Desulfuromonadales bacterium]|nr:acyltransferase [Desulfuromonadales bacterium]
MNISKIIKRFAPSYFVTIFYFMKFGCLISPRAEVEISSFLKIGKNTNIGSFTKIKASEGPLSIGSNTTIGVGCHIGSGKKGIRIGKDCLISAHVIIIGNNYKYDKIHIPIREQGFTYKGTSIDDNVWIGAGSCILDGSEIGSGSIISPNSVVSAKIPPNSIVQGNPAKVIFTRR